MKKLLISTVAAAACLFAQTSYASLGYPEANTLVPEGTQRYAVSVFPDRVILMPGTQAATTQQVAWRTDSSVEQSVAQISVAQNTPGLHFTATELVGAFVSVTTANGVAHHTRSDPYGAQRESDVVCRRFSQLALRCT